MAPHSTEARALLESALDDEDEIVRLQAAGFLAEGNRPSARVTGILIGGLIYKDQRAESGFALWNTGALASAVSHENRRVRQGAAAFMKTFGIPGPAEAEALLRALTTRDPEMRALAASVFEHESSYAEQAEPVLATVLSDKRISVAIAAAKALAANGIRRADSLPRVYAAMGRKGMTIELAEALGSLGAEVVPDLMRYLREGSVRERAFAAIALGHVGRAASPALDLLMELSEKGDERVRLAAGIAVRDILAEIPPQAIGIGGRSEK
jgi:HEAT repeat protein